MATVRLSQELRGTITKKAERLMDRQLPPHTYEYGDVIMKGDYRALVENMIAPPSLLEKLKNVPEGYIKYEKELSLRGLTHNISVNIDGFEFNERDCKTTEFKFDPPLPVPLDDTVKKAMGFSTDWQGLRLVPEHPAVAPFLEEFKAQTEKYARFLKRKNEFIDSVRKVLENHTTLSAALRTWPPLWDLVPEEAKERHKEPNSSRKRKDIEQRVKEEVDINSLTAALTASKMIGGKE